MTDSAHLGWLPLSIAVIALSFSVETLGQDQEANFSKNPQRLFDAIVDARSQLVRGVFRGRGHRILSDDGERIHEGKLEFLCMFDEVDKIVRWDRVDPENFLPMEILDGDDIKFSRVTYVKRPDMQLYAETPPGTLSTDGLSIVPDDFDFPDKATPIDPRTFGLMDWASVDQGATFETTKQSLMNVEGAEVRKDPDGRYRIKTKSSSGDVQFEIWVNIEQGFTVERSELRVKNPGTSAWGKIYSSADITWEKVDEVWVPRSIYLERQVPFLHSYFAKLEWENVNAPLDPKDFEIRNLSINPAAIVIDRRSGDRPTYLGRVRDNGELPSYAE